MMENTSILLHTHLRFPSLSKTFHLRKYYWRPPAQLRSEYAIHDFAIIDLESTWQNREKACYQEFWLAILLNPCCRGCMANLLLLCPPVITVASLHKHVGMERVRIMRFMSLRLLAWTTTSYYHHLR